MDGHARLKKSLPDCWNGIVIDARNDTEDKEASLERWCQQESL